MRTLNRHILLRLLITMLVVLLGLVMVAWFTQIIRLLDIVVVNGRSVVEFLGITLLLMPLIIAIIMPTALFIATVFVLNRMNADSELAVISAAGISRWRLLRPFMVASIAAIAVALIATVVLQPVALNKMRLKQAEVRSDLMSNVITEGQFVAPAHGLMAHVRSKSDSGELLGVIFEDRRTPDAPTTYLARTARLVERDGQTFMFLTDGSALRAHKDRSAVDLVHFNEYSLNLSSFFSQRVSSGPRPEEMTISALMDPDNLFAAQNPLRLSAELNRRLSNPLYTLVAMLIAFAALCEPRTARKNRIWAIVIATMLGGVVRVLGFVLVTSSGRIVGLSPFIYAVPLICMVGTLAFMNLHHRRAFIASRSAPPPMDAAGSGAMAGSA